MPPSFASRRTKNRIMADSQNSRESETEDSPRQTRGKRNKRKNTRTLFIARISQTVMKATMMTMEWHTSR